MTASNAIDGKVLSDLGLMRDASMTKNKEMGQKDFLTLMVAQLKNQDPLEPSDNAEFLGQMAQFSTLDGINGMKESFDGFASSMTSGQALQASSLVGRKVLVSSDTAQLVPGQTLSGNVAVTEAVSALSVSIVDSSGKLVKTQSLGPHPAGDALFEWDGLDDKGIAAAPGNYIIRAEGQSNGKSQTFGTGVFANVDSVTLGKDMAGVQLNVRGVGTLALNQIKQIQ
jgi:flagellar basal-body rod modification protein FlgD